MNYFEGEDLAKKVLVGFFPDSLEELNKLRSELSYLLERDFLVAHNEHPLVLRALERLDRKIEIKKESEEKREQRLKDERNFFHTRVSTWVAVIVGVSSIVLGILGAIFSSNQLMLYKQQIEIDLRPKIEVSVSDNRLFLENIGESSVYDPTVSFNTGKEIRLYPDYNDQPEFKILERGERRAISIPEVLEGQTIIVEIYYARKKWQPNSYVERFPLGNYFIKFEGGNFVLH